MLNNSTFHKQITSLYSSGKSMNDIAKELNCSIHKIAYWMDKHGIKRRTWSEASYIKQNPQGDPFTVKTKLNEKELILYGLGIGIYLGEGEKVSKHAVRVANTDPVILKTFIKFLLEICQLQLNKISYSIVCFNDSTPDKVRSYWTKQLETSEGKFGKIVQIPPQGKGNYKRKSQFGVCTVTVCNTKLKGWIMSEISRGAWIA